jgi:hypothetical protein
MCTYVCMHLCICFFCASQTIGLFKNFDTSFPVAMSNQELINAGTKTMDETDQAIVRTQKVNNFLKQDLAQILVVGDLNS